jgi:hypothetical protein
MLVRFKCDACLPKQIATSSDLGSQPAKNDPLDGLMAGFQKLTVNESSITTTIVPTFNGAFLTVHERRRALVPQSDLLELKTRSELSVDKFDWNDTFSQLMLSQTPNIFLCVHKRGEFQEVRERKLVDLETEEMARKAQEGLRRLRKVLGVLQTMMMEEGEGARCSLICKPGADMILYEREDAGKFLPKDILKKFK